MVELLKQLSGAALEDNRMDLASLAQYVRAGRTNVQEQQLDRLREAHRIFDVQVLLHAHPSACALKVPPRMMLITEVTCSFCRPARATAYNATWAQPEAAPAGKVHCENGQPGATVHRQGQLSPFWRACHMVEQGSRTHVWHLSCMAGQRAGGR